MRAVKTGMVGDVQKKNWRMGKGWIVAIACILLMAGCGHVEQDESAVSSPPEKEEYPKIVMTVQTLKDQSVTDDFEEVMQAVNEITTEEIGVKVEARLIDATEAFTEYSLWISNKEQVDLMMLNYQDITAYINRNMLKPMDELLQTEGQYILSLHNEECRPSEGSVVEGRTYGVTTIAELPGNGGGLWIPSRYLKGAGIPYEKEKVYDLEALTEIFRKLKQSYPDKYPLGQITANETASTASYYLKPMDALGGELMSGVVDEDTMKVENFFALQQYREFLSYLREWYEAGYIYPDSAFTNYSKMELIKEQIIMSYPLASAPGFSPEWYMNEAYVCLKTTPPVVGRQYAKSGFWVIPVTSREPEAAMRFLNLMYEDERIGNLLNYGIEGKHYVVTDAENRLIAYPDGIDERNVGYVNPLGLYGDYRRLYRRYNLEELKEREAYSEEAKKHVEGIPMVYTTSNVSRQMAQLSEVVQEYVPVLESGSVDPDVYYPEFLKALDNAGMEEVIADKQRQLDQWLESQ